MTAKEGVKASSCADWLWGRFSRATYLFIAASLLLFMMLGARELWTQEHRWADIVSGMFFRHDFLHPYLGTNDYYDKPLLSYWLIAVIAAVTQNLNTWAIRLPSALAGLLAVWSLYRLGWRLKDKSFGLLSGWLLLTTFYFVFWARVSSADMLNLAGSLFAVYWYFEKREQPNSLNYGIFFLIIALTSLCKGLGGAVVAVLAIVPDLLHQQRWKKHLQWCLLWSALPALLLYILPFWLSAHFGGEHYAQNGLYLVYRENVLRYFQPFDHKDPVYTYFIFLPLYLLPWTLFSIPAVCSLPKRWPTLSWSSKWIVWALFSLFLFFTLSGSRRSYYVLPLLPFAILMTADWLDVWMQQALRRRLWSGRLIVGFFLALFMFFGVFQPLYYAQGGHRRFAEKLQVEASQLKPWDSWQFFLLDPESKVAFYLHLPPAVNFFGVEGDREQQTTGSLLKIWPVLKERPKDVIFISRKHYAATLQQLLPDYQEVDAPPTLAERWSHQEDPNASIAFIPRV
jgi:4-amino-4-deoxy-L-arabinose transferase-like glycosyltransferase